MLCSCDTVSKGRVSVLPLNVAFPQGKPFPWLVGTAWSVTQQFPRSISSAPACVGLLLSVSLGLSFVSQSRGGRKASGTLAYFSLIRRNSCLGRNLALMLGDIELRGKV